MPESLENRLTAALAPVRAPEELWAQLTSALPMPVRRTNRSIWPRLAMAAAVAGLMTGGVLYLRAANQWTGLPTGEVSHLVTDAVRIHRGQLASTPDFRGATYTVQRHVIGGQPVTVLSATAASSDTQPQGKRLEMIEMDDLAISEWTSEGRTWALVATKAVQRQACFICHRA